MLGRSRRLALLFLTTTLHLAAFCIAVAGEPDMVRLSWRIAQAKGDEKKAFYYMSVARQRRVKERRPFPERTTPKESAPFISGRLPPSGR